MSFRFLSQTIVIAAIALGEMSLYAQGNQQLIKTAALPFGGTSRQNAGSLGSVNYSVDQAVDLGIARELDAEQSTSTGPNHLLTSRTGRRPTVLSLSDTMASSGAQKLSQVNLSAKPSYMNLPQADRRMITSVPLLSVNRQSRGQTEANSSKNTSGQTIQPRGVGVFTRPRVAFRAQAREAYEVLRNRGLDEPPVAQEGTQTLLERFHDPFLSVSKASFEGFKSSFDFERSCGDACSMRPHVSAGFIDGALRGQARDMQDEQLPATKVVYGGELNQSSQSDSILKSKPY